jgi:hypothetical protein
VDTTDDDEPDDETATLFQSNRSLERTTTIKRDRTTTEMVHQDGGDKETKDNNGTNDKNR